MKIKSGKVKDIQLSGVNNADDLVRQMYDSGGFTAKHLAVGVEILETIFKDKECTTFISFPASLIATGTRGIIKDLIKERLVDVVITTCGTLDHDLARVWRNYYHGSFLMDDIELHRKDVNRLGNILIPNKSYGIVLERKVQPILKQLWVEGKKELSSKELVWEFGSRLKDENSVVYWASKNRIPVYIPGIADGAVGSQLWLFSQEHKNFKIDILKDENELSEIVFKAKRTGALIIGGGISKHHTIWWNQFRGGLDYAVYITTAVEHDGSLSGARLREAISWGKVKERARHVTIDGDATLILPLMIKAVLERLAKGV